MKRDFVWYRQNQKTLMELIEFHCRIMNAVKNAIADCRRVVTVKILIRFIMECIAKIV